MLSTPAASSILASLFEETLSYDRVRYMTPETQNGRPIGRPFRFKNYDAELLTATAVSPASTSTAATVSTTSATSTSTTVTSASSAPSSATTARTIFHRAGFIDCQLAAAKLGGVQFLDRLGGFFLRAHLDEAESARLTSHAVLDDIYRQHSACFGEVILKVVFSNAVIDVADEEFGRHGKDV